jgi:glycosyltransferase involved in cell wall biosynthesis
MVTPEYPPQVGGVSYYAFEVAGGLAAQGDEVHVWCPASDGVQPQAPGVVVHRELGAMTPRDLRHAGDELDRFGGRRRILVQWVPHGYGYQSMNLAFCWWIRNRVARRGDSVEIMLHEPFLRFGRNLRQSAAALVHRLMTMVLLRAAGRVWVSIPQWEACWRPYALGRTVPFAWLPIPSGIPVMHNPGASQRIRQRYAGENGFLIGHFGTFGWPITSLLEPLLVAMAGDPIAQTVLFIGRGGEQFRDALILKEPRLANMLHAAGELAPQDLSHHLSACDVLLEPFPDGVSTRRSTVMAGLAHGKPILTNLGELSEPFWGETRALALAPAGDVNAYLTSLRQLHADAGERARLGRAARNLYQERFDISYTIAALRGTALGARDSVPLEGVAAASHRSL